MLAVLLLLCCCYCAGLGALLVRRSLLPLLLAHKAYFGGGTVEVAVAQQLHAVR
jgi:selenocysteine lyase/cysteine desulfurase